MAIQDQIAKMVAERAGIDPDTATKAVDAMLGFLNENPDKVAELLGDDSPLGDAASKVTKLFGR